MSYNNHKISLQNLFLVDFLLVKSEGRGHVILTAVCQQFESRIRLLSFRSFDKCNLKDFNTLVLFISYEFVSYVIYTCRCKSQFESILSIIDEKLESVDDCSIYLRYLFYYQNLLNVTKSRSHSTILV